MKWIFAFLYSLRGLLLIAFPVARYGRKAAAGLPHSKSLAAVRRAWRRTALHFGWHGDGARAVLADGAHRKKMIVGGNTLQDRLARFRNKVIDAPARVGRFAPQNFEARAVGILFAGPRDFRVGRDRAFEAGICRRSRSHRELAQNFGVVARDVAHEGVIQILFK